jgi:ATP-binding cassette subfamily F protein uup
MNRVVDHIFVFEGNGAIKVINGNYNDYRDERRAAAKEQKKQETKLFKPDTDVEFSSVVKPEKKKLTFKEKLEFDKLEKEIFSLEEDKSNIEMQLSSAI